MGILDIPLSRINSSQSSSHSRSPSSLSRNPFHRHNGPLRTQSVLTTLISFLLNTANEGQNSSRRKLGEDPNNTKWSRNENNFGQKILRAHGWTPGKFLGAQNSAHANLHSAASSAPIKVVLKDDTMGLGAKQRQKQSTECTGLDGFKDLLGRLNGKSDDVIETERKLRSDIKTSVYVERRFGTMRFVSGGLLVGDQMQELVSTDPATCKAESAEQSTAESVDAEEKQSKKAKKEKKSKKRKAEEAESAEVSDITREKKRKKRSKDTVEHESTENSESQDSSKKRKKSKRSKEKDESDKDPKEKKAKKEKKTNKSKDKPSSVSELDPEQQAPSTSDDVASKEKEDKKRRKREKKEKKSKSSREIIRTDNPTPATTTPAESGTSTPTGTGTSTPIVANRHHVRARFIASKRSAIADMQALNQVRDSNQDTRWLSYTHTHLY